MLFMAYYFEIGAVKQLLHESNKFTFIGNIFQVSTAFVKFYYCVMHVLNGFHVTVNQNLFFSVTNLFPKTFNQKT